MYRKYCKLINVNINQLDLFIKENNILEAKINNNEKIIMIDNDVTRKNDMKYSVSK